MNISEGELSDVTVVGSVRPVTKIVCFTMPDLVINKATKNLCQINNLASLKAKIFKCVVNKF